jgi:hypothetical protein
MNDLSPESIPNATGLRPLLESTNRGFLQGELIGVVDRYAAFSQQGRVAALVALKIKAAELSEADLGTGDSK